MTQDDIAKIPVGPDLNQAVDRIIIEGPARIPWDYCGSLLAEHRLLSWLKSKFCLVRLWGITTEARTAWYASVADGNSHWRDFDHGSETPAIALCRLVVWTAQHERY
jgi:hypothetical protein